MIKKLILLTLIYFISYLGMSGCSDPVSDQDSDLPTEISGFVQKGPFINGTQVSLYELNSELGQTGNNFLAQVNNDIGSFEIDNVDLNSNYVLLSANGYYFNEVTGEISSSQLTLTALSDLSDRSTVNVNILTHIESGRIEHLIDDNYSFEEAKSTAQEEALALFGFDVSNINNSESIDISNDDEDAAVLLAISLILQGNRSVGELTEFLANLSSDFKSDGTLSNESIMNELLDSAFQLNYEQIRNNLESRYESLNMEASVPEFEKYIKDFVSGFDGKFLCNDLLITDEQGNQLGSRGDPSDQWKGLHPAYPNPTDDLAALGYQLPEASHVEISLYETSLNYEYIVNQKMAAGIHEVIIDFADRPVGCYKVEFQAGEHSTYGLILFEE